MVHGGVRLACKKMSLTVAGERARIEALLKREFRALQQAQHPHIVRLHGVVTDDPTSLSLLMGLSPIGSLRKLLDQRPDEVLQSEVAQLALLTGIALGMAHLHAQLPKPILHHDLKVASESNTTLTLTLPLTTSSPSQSSTMITRLPICSC